MKVQIDNKVVTVELCSEGFYVLNENSQRASHHTFPAGHFNSSVSQSFWTNGHHYMTGELVGTKCNRQTCTACNPTTEESDGS